MAYETGWMVKFERQIEVANHHPVWDSISLCGPGWPQALRMKPFSCFCLLRSWDHSTCCHNWLWIGLGKWLAVEKEGDGDFRFSSWVVDGISWDGEVELRLELIMEVWLLYISVVILTDSTHRSLDLGECRCQVKAQMRHIRNWSCGPMWTEAFLYNEDQIPEYLAMLSKWEISEWGAGMPLKEDYSFTEWAA